MLKKQDQRLAENKLTQFTFNGEPVNEKLDRSRKRLASTLANHTESSAACRFLKRVRVYLTELLQLRHQMSNT